MRNPLKSLFKLRRILPLSFGLMTLLSINACAQDEKKRPQILVSIQPIALLVRDLVGDQADVHTLLPSGASPHHFQLKVSDRKRLLEADTLIWVGEDMERFLEKVANQRVERNQTVIELMAVAGLEWPQNPGEETREPVNPSEHKKHGGEDTHHDDLHQSEHNHSHNHAHGVDPHLWLNPANVQRVWLALAAQLSEQFPQLSDTINANLSGQTASLLEVTSEVEAAYKAVTRGYYVYHDGVGHFAAANSLNQLAALTQVPDDAISAKHLHALSQKGKNAACLIADWSEVQQASKYAARLALRVTEVDVLATQTAYSSFNAYYRNFAKQFEGCFILAQ